MPRLQEVRLQVESVDQKGFALAEKGESAEERSEEVLAAEKTNGSEFLDWSFWIRQAVRDCVFCRPYYRCYF